MRRVRIGIIGGGTFVEGAILPALSSASLGQPPDEGAWWLKRPSSRVDIAYQAPVRPEVVALCDADAERGARVANAWRVRATYADWRAMIAEAPLDVLILASEADETYRILCDLGTRRFDRVAPWIWLVGPPAVDVESAREVARLHANRAVWLAHPLRQAAAHRAARRLIERDEIGRVAALNLRWSAPLCRAQRMKDEGARMKLGAQSTAGAFQSTAAAFQSTAGRAEKEMAAPAHLASSFAAFDLLMACGASRGEKVLRMARRVTTVENAGASVVLMQLASGVGATALFCAADEWSAPLPRLEICGEDGRVLICQGGREVQLLQPREATRLLSLPGLSPSSPDAAISGVVEDLKAFFAAWNVARETDAPFEMSDNFPDLRGAVPVLQLIEVAGEAARSGVTIDLEKAADESAQRAPIQSAAPDESAPAVIATLPMQF